MGLRAAAARALSMTDWWYSYEPCEKFIRTNKTQRSQNINVSKTDFSTMTSRSLVLRLDVWTNRR